MKILLIGRSKLTSYGGVQSFIRHLLTFFASEDVVASYLEIPRFQDAQPYVVYSAGLTQHSSIQISDSCPVSAIIEQLSPSLIHSHNLHTPFRFTVKELELITTRMNLPHVLTIHDVGSHDLSMSTLKTLTATTICTQSQFNQQVLTCQLGIPHVTRLPVGISFDTWTPEPMPTGSMFACPCRLSPGKGIEAAIHLLGVASRSLGRLSLCLSDPRKDGFGQTHAFLGYLAELSKPYNNLSVVFNLSTDLRDMYKQCVATLVLPTLIEGFNLVSLESLAMARPVLASPTGGMSEWMTGQRGVVLFNDKLNAEHFTNQVKLLLDNRLEWYSKALASRADLSRLYDIGVVGGAHCRLYRSLVSAA